MKVSSASLDVPIIAFPTPQVKPFSFIRPPKKGILYNFSKERGGFFQIRVEILIFPWYNEEDSGRESIPRGAPETGERRLTWLISKNWTP
jgi:hypothetical protein